MRVNRSRVEPLRQAARQMSARESVFQQLLAQIAGAGLEKSIEALEAAASHRFLPACSHDERLAEFFACEALRQLPHLHHLVNGHAEIARLLLKPVAEFHAGFRSIDKIEAENVFQSAYADLETVTVVAPFHKVMTRSLRDSTPLDLFP